MPAPLCAIADDFTGATDLANTLVCNGMRTVQLIGTPVRRAPEDVDAVVVALKTLNYTGGRRRRPIAGGAALAASNEHAADSSKIVLLSIRPIVGISARLRTR